MAQRIKPKPETKNKNNQSKILILVGVLVLAAVILLVKNWPAKTVEAVEVVEKSPEAQLDDHLAEGKPVFAFFHSNNCYSCIEMMKTVDQVYPEFGDSVMLVDVNVYDEINQNLLRRAQINSIPTQVFIDRIGQARVVIGGMAADVLRSELQTLSEGVR